MHSVQEGSSRPRPPDTELGNNIYNTTTHLKRQATAPAAVSCSQPNGGEPTHFSRGDPRSSERSRSQRSKGQKGSQRSKGSQRKQKMKPTEQHQPPPPPPPPPLPDSDVVFASYSIAGPTGVINTDVSLPTPATVPIRDPDELQNPYEDPMQPEQAGNNVIFTGYALARRASESDHKYQYLETTAPAQDILRNHQGLGRTRPVSTFQQQSTGKVPPAVPKRRDPARQTEEQPRPAHIRKSGSSPDFQQHSILPAIKIQPATGKKTNTAASSNRSVAEPLSLLKRSPIEPLLSPQRKTKAAVPLPQKPSEPSRNPPGEQRPNKYNQSSPATPPTVMVLHNPTYFDCVPGSSNGKPTFAGKARPAPPPPKPGTAEKYEKELPPLPNLGNDRYKTLPPLPKAGTPKNHVRPPGAAP